MRNSLKLALGGSAAALLGLAPLAHAAGPGPVPDQSNVVCSTNALPPSGGQVPGEGMIVAGATNGADITCSYASTAGVASHIAIASLNAWELTDAAGNVLAAQGNVTNGGSPMPEADYTAPGGAVTLTVHAAVDTNSGAGGANVQAVAGGVKG